MQAARRFAREPLVAPIKTHLTLELANYVFHNARTEPAVTRRRASRLPALAAHHVEARLCRWLLRARDLAGTDTLEFTQEFLAEMLGVKRTSVTLHARLLQQAGLIEYSRGKIRITDVEAMQETVCECYETVKAYYRALLGPQPG